MSPRIYIDREAGISFRFPYHFYMPDPFGSTIRGRIFDDEGKRQGILSIRCFSRLKADIPATFSKDNWSAIATWIAGHSYDRQVRYKYYRGDSWYPHRHEDWAPAGIRAYMLSTDTEEMLLIDHGDRISGLMMDVIHPGNEDIVHSFEVMRPVEVDGETTYMTWNRSRCDDRYCILGRGHIEKKDRMKRPTKWEDAYELETEHFHFTTTCLPRYVDDYARHLEDMYAGLRKWLPIDREIKTKYEVHITKTRQEFTQIGNFFFGDVDKAFNVRSNSTLGGFFNPMTRAMYTFTEKVQYSKMSNKVRMGHEFVHQYTFMNSTYNYSMPGWFNEGIATFFEEGFADRHHEQVRSSGTRMRLLKMVYKEHGFLGNMDTYLRGAGIGNVHQYAEASAIIHQLLNEDGGQQRLRELWSAVKQRHNGTRAFNQIFASTRLNGDDREADLEAWKKSVLLYVKSGRAAKLTKWQERVETAPVEQFGVLSGSR